jgi:hypothetical protein
MKEINLGRSLRKWVLDAMFCMGIMKVGLDANGTVNIGGTDHAVGQPFAEVVDLDDWVHDFTATDISRCAFMGNRWYAPKEDVLRTGMFDEEVIASVPVEDFKQNNEMGGQRAAAMSQGGASFTGSEFRPNISLWDIWIPSEKVIITIADNDGIGRAARVVEWTGPKDGPFHLLFFDEVPANIMPLSPVSNLMDLHDLANRVFRKLGRQAERQKTITLVKSGATADGKRVVSANDGDTIESDDPRNVTTASYGGVEPQALAFSIQLEQIFNRQAGNVFTIGGLGAMSKTVGQDQLLSENAGKTVVAMQDATVDATSKVCRDLCYWLFTDPAINLPLTKSVAGIDIPIRVTPDTMQGEFIDYNFTIDPYSMQHNTPFMKLQTLKATMSEVIFPLLGQFEQQGKVVNVDELLKLVAKLSDTPELLSIISSATGPTMPDENIVGQPRKPPVSTRNYVRTNVSGGVTVPGQAQVLQQALLGKKMQPSQAAPAVMGGAM